MFRDNNLKKQILIALLATIAFILMFFELPLPIFPNFLKFDISDLPAIIAGMALGPVSGIMVELIKNVLHLFLKSSETGGVGELANFIVGSSYVVIFSIVYRYSKDLKGVLIGAGLATLFMSIVGGLINYALLIPFYAKFMPIDQIVAAGTVINPNIVDVMSLILFAIVPFNIIKGIIIGIFILIIHKRVIPLIEQ